MYRKAHTHTQVAVPTKKPSKKQTTTGGEGEIQGTIHFKSQSQEAKHEK